MKKNIFVFILLIGLLTACYNSEDALTPSDITSMSRFEFPEGNEAHDQIFSDIYDKFAIQVIYKNWTAKDFEKSWLNPSLGMNKDMGGFHFSNGEIDTLKLASEFMRDMFRDLGPEITGKIFPQYIYLVNSYFEQQSLGPLVFCGFVSTASASGMDYEIISPQSNSAWLPGITPTAHVNGLLHADRLERHKLKLAILFKLYFKVGFTKGYLAYPADFNEGLDRTTPIVNNNPDDPNYYLKREFVDIISDAFSRVETPNTGSYPSRYPAYYVTNPTFPFMDYLKTAMYFTEAQVIERYGAYPAIMERYYRVVNYMMDNYKIDLKGMAVYE